MDYITALLGQHARHVPAWLYVQRQDTGIVSFVGASRTDSPVHPLRYGSDRTHQFIIGEIIVRPHLVIATDILRGDGLGALATADHDITQMLRNGEPIIGR
jgi:hypothetical protein